MAGTRLINPAFKHLNANGLTSEKWWTPKEISYLSLDTFGEFSLKSYSTNSHIFQLANPKGLANSEGLSSVTFLLSTVFIICELEQRARGCQDKIHALNHKQNWKENTAVIILFLALIFLVVKHGWLWVFRAVYCHYFTLLLKKVPHSFLVWLSKGREIRDPV